MASVRRKSSRRRDLRWGVFLAVAFAYVLCLTYERIELKERNGRIERYERALQEAKSDESMLRVTIERECNYADVHRLAREKWGMDVAQRSQRIFLALDETPRAKADPTEQINHAGLVSVAERVTRLFRENVAQAHPRPSGAEGGDVAPAR